MRALLIVASLAIAGCLDLSSLTAGNGADADAAPDSDNDDAAVDAVDAAADDAASGCQPGTVCHKATDPCRTDAVCDAQGVCGQSGVRPDGYGYDSAEPIYRCCGGKSVRVDTAQNCGACGISCGSNPCLYTHGPHYFCACSENSDCWSQCCSTAYGLPNVCAAGECSTNQPIACPGNAILSDDALGPYYCHY